MNLRFRTRGCAPITVVDHGDHLAVLCVGQHRACLDSYGMVVLVGQHVDLDVHLCRRLVVSAHPDLDPGETQAPDRIRPLAQPRPMIWPAPGRPGHLRAEQETHGPAGAQQGCIGQAGVKVPGS